MYLSETGRSLPNLKKIQIPGGGGTLEKGRLLCIAIRILLVAVAVAVRIYRWRSAAIKRSISASAAGSVIAAVLVPPPYPHSSRAPHVMPLSYGALWVVRKRGR